MTFWYVKLKISSILEYIKDISMKYIQNNIFFIFRLGLFSDSVFL